MPFCVHICMNPDQFGLQYLPRSEDFQRTSKFANSSWAKISANGLGLYTRGLHSCMDSVKGVILIVAILTISSTDTWAFLICLLGLWVLGVTAATIPIPWNVPLPSKVACNVVVNVVSYKLMILSNNRHFCTLGNSSILQNMNKKTHVYAMCLSGTEMHNGGAFARQDLVAEGYISWQACTDFTLFTISLSAPTDQNLSEKCPADLGRHTSKQASCFDDVEFLICIVLLLPADETHEWWKQLSHEEWQHSLLLMRMLLCLLFLIFKLQELILENDT